MDIKNFIASGMVEGYLFELSSEDEKKDFVLRLKNEVELQQEFIFAQQNLCHIAACYSIVPDAEIGIELEEKLTQLERNPEPEKHTIIESAEEMVVKKAPSIVRLTPFVIAASLAIMSLSTFLAYKYYSDFSAEKNQLEIYMKNASQTELKLNLIKKENDQKSVILNYLLQNGTIILTLNGDHFSYLVLYIPKEKYLCLKPNGNAPVSVNFEFKTGKEWKPLSVKSEPWYENWRLYKPVANSISGLRVISEGDSNSNQPFTIHGEIQW